jgi:hypothetical protein
MARSSKLNKGITRPVEDRPVSALARSERRRQLGRQVLCTADVSTTAAPNHRPAHSNSPAILELVIQTSTPRVREIENDHVNVRTFCAKLIGLGLEPLMEFLPVAAD